MQKLLLVTFLLSLFTICFGKTDDCLPVGLLCEYMVSLIGIDAANPRLKWKIKDTRQKGGGGGECV